MEVRLLTGGSGFRVTTEDLRLELGNRLTLVCERPLMVLMLEFRDEFCLALLPGEMVRLELMLDTDEDDDEVFLLLSTVLEFGFKGALSADGARNSVLLWAGMLVLREESLISEATLVVSERRSSEEPAMLVFL